MEGRVDLSSPGPAVSLADGLSVTNHTGTIEDLSSEDDASPVTLDMPVVLQRHRAGRPCRSSIEDAPL